MALQTETKSAAAATHCPYCAFQCGMNISLASGQLEVSGDPEFPVNRGALCVKGWTAAQTMAHPERLLTPPNTRRGRRPQAGKLGGGAGQGY